MMKIERFGGIKFAVEADTLSKLPKRSVKRLCAAIAEVLSETSKLNVHEGIEGEIGRKVRLGGMGK